MSNLLTEVGSATINPFVQLWHSILNYIPGIIAAIFVAILGYVVAYFIGNIVKHALQKARLDKWIKNKNLTKTVLNIRLSVLAGQLVKWGIFISFLVTAADLIKLTGISLLIRSFALWIPKLILAIVVLTFGVVIAKIIAVEIYNKSSKTAQVISKVVQITLVIIFFDIALKQIGIATTIIEKIVLLVIGTVLLVSAIVVGISFGHAGKKYADRLVEDFFKKRKKK